MTSSDRPRIPATAWIVLVIGAILLVGGGAGFGVAAYAAYDRSGQYFARAGYITNCLPTARPPATATTCAKLRAAPDALGNVPLTDKDLTTAYAEGVHGTGDALVVMAGIWVAVVVGVTGLILTASSLKR